MLDKNKLLDAVERREKTRIFRRVLKYGGFALVFGALLVFAEFKNYDRVKFSHELDAVIESIETLATKDPTYVVKLENEKIIKIFEVNDVVLHQGEAVKVLREELESGRLQYSIVKEKLL